MSSLGNKPTHKEEALMSSLGNKPTHKEEGGFALCHCCDTPYVYSVNNLLYVLSTKMRTGRSGPWGRTVRTGGADGPRVRRVD
jgi:hypothetical protein